MISPHTGRKKGLRGQSPPGPVTAAEMFDVLYLRLLIFSYFDWNELLRMESVRVSWNDPMSSNSLWKVLLHLYFGSGATAKTKVPGAEAISSSKSPSNDALVGLAALIYRDLFRDTLTSSLCIHCKNVFNRQFNTPSACSVSQRWHVSEHCPPELSPNEASIATIMCRSRRDRAQFLFFFPPSTSHIVAACICVFDAIDKAYSHCMSVVDQTNGAALFEKVAAEHYPFWHVLVDIRRSGVTDPSAYLRELPEARLTRIIQSPLFP